MGPARFPARSPLPSPQPAAAGLGFLKQLPLSLLAFTRAQRPHGQGLTPGHGPGAGDDISRGWQTRQSVGPLVDKKFL